MWLIVLSDQLPIVALVGRYPTNKLIGRGTIPERPKPFPRRAYAVLAAVSSGYSPLWGRFPRVTHPSATRVTGRSRALVRLACVKHAASVRSEPGSNSQVEIAGPEQQLATLKRQAATRNQDVNDEPVPRTTPDGSPG